MKKITRRAALKGTAAVAVSTAAITAAGPVAATPHEPLLGFWRELQQVRALNNALLMEGDGLLRAGDSAGCWRLEDKAMEVYGSKIARLECQITEAQAQTVKGAAIQARLLAEFVELGQMASDDRDPKLAQNLAAGLERLVGEG